MTFRAFAGPGGVGNVSGNAGYITGLKEKGIFSTVKGHITTVGMADTDLKAIMKMKIGTGSAGDPPIVSGKKENGEVMGEKIISVFCNSVLGFWHITPLRARNL